MTELSGADAATDVQDAGSAGERAASDDLCIIGKLGTASVVSQNPTASIQNVVGKVAGLSFGLAIGRSCSDRSFTQQIVPFAQHLDAESGLLTRFERGQKDGQCIVLAELEGRERKLDRVIRVYGLALDLDTGTEVREAALALAKHGWFGVIYTTHSHLKSETHVALKALDRYARNNRGFTGHIADIPPELVIDFLRDVKKYRDRVLDGATVAPRAAFNDGAETFLVTHRPLSKLRILLPFKTPYEFRGRDGDHKAALREYTNAYHTVGEASGLAYDTACSDAVRLHYTPRVPREAQVGEGQHEIVVVDGAPLDFEHYCAVDQTRANKAKTRRGANFSGGAAGGPQSDIQDFDLFLAHSQDLQAGDAVAELAPDTVVTSVDNDSGVGVDAECPAVELHTEQKPGDRRFAARNATENKPWTMFCLGATCSETSGKDRAWYLHQFLLKHGLSVEDLLPFSAKAAAHFAGKRAEQEAWQAAENLAADEMALRTASIMLGHRPASDALRKVLRAIACIDDELVRDRFITQAGKDTKEARNDIRKGVQRLRQERARSESTADAHDAVKAATADLTERFKWVSVPGAFYDTKTKAMRPDKVVYNEVYSDLPLTSEGKRVSAQSVLLDNPSSKFDKLAYRPNAAREFEEDGLRLLNTYQATTLQPLMGDAAPMIRHIQFIFGLPIGADETTTPYDKAECDHFLDWLAHKAQHPEKKLRHAAIICSEEGMGKGTIAKPLKHIFGPTNYIEPDNTEIDKGELGFFESKVFVVVHELMIGDRRGIANQLKTAITEDTINVRKLYIDAYSIDNPASLLCFTNHYNMIDVTNGDRRYFIYRCKWGIDQRPLPEYFAALHKWLDGDGTAIFYRWLLDRDVRHFNPNMPAPMTEDKLGVIDASMGEGLVVVKELFEAGEAPFDKDLIILRDVMTELKETHKLSRLSRAGVAVFLRGQGAAQLDESGPVAFKAGAVVRKARIWALRDVDEWRAAAADDIGAILIGRTQSGALSARSAGWGVELEGPGSFFTLPKGW